MTEQSVDERALFAAAAASYIKAGYRVESDVPGMLVVVAAQLKIPVGLMLVLTVITFGLWLPVWGVLWGLPRVNRHTFTMADGAVVNTSTWRTA